jgi:hypothetical protein
MRKALNENPVVQAAFIGVLALAIVVMFVMRMGGGAEPPPSTGVTTPVTESGGAAPATGTATPADPAAPAPTPSTPAPGADAAQPQTGNSGGGGGQQVDFEAGPGLPKDVVNAFDSGKAVVLLIVNRDGIDDRRLEETTQELRSNPDATVFVTDVKDVARYSRITQGVDLNRTPALVVVQPKRLTEGTMPVATVAYGFRGASSARQALDDALYNGPQNLPYYPN